MNNIDEICDLILAAFPNVTRGADATKKELHGIVEQALSISVNIKNGQLVTEFGMSGMSLSDPNYPTPEQIHKVFPTHRVLFKLPITKQMHNETLSTLSNIFTKSAAMRLHIFDLIEHKNLISESDIGKSLGIKIDLSTFKPTENIITAEMVELRKHCVELVFGTSEVI